MLYGLMTEEINHSYDGGLYAELIPNRALHGNDSWRAPIEYWSVVERGDSQSFLRARSDHRPSAALPYSLRLAVERATATTQAGIANAGYWGVPVRPAPHIADRSTPGALATAALSTSRL